MTKAETWKHRADLNLGNRHWTLGLQSPASPFSSLAELCTAGGIIASKYKSLRVGQGGNSYSWRVEWIGGMGKQQKGWEGEEQRGVWESGMGRFGLNSTLSQTNHGSASCLFYSSAFKSEAYVPPKRRWRSTDYMALYLRKQNYLLSGPQLRKRFSNNPPPPLRYWNQFIVHSKFAPRRLHVLRI
jgi:hypothetical protein